MPKPKKPTKPSEELDVKDKLDYRKMWEELVKVLSRILKGPRRHEVQFAVQTMRKIEQGAMLEVPEYVEALEAAKKMEEEEHKAVVMERSMAAERAAAAKRRLRGHEDTGMDEHELYNPR